MNILHTSLEILNKINRSISGGHISNYSALPSHSSNENTNSPQQDRIKQLVSSDKPIMMARFGSIELAAFLNYRQVIGQYDNQFGYSSWKYINDRCFPKWFSIKTKNGMQNNAGFFPAYDKLLLKWGGLTQNDIEELDALFTWLNTEKYIKDLLKSKEQILNSEMYFPYMFLNPWTESLQGKKVLVVSPFADLIKSQYRNNREKLFADPKVLPEFDLKTITAYNVLRGINPYKNISTWFDALYDMERQMDSIDYDIALLGCGAYSFNLAAHAKRMGKKGITLCGSHEVLFGIYGTRYEAYLRSNNIINKYWVRPSDKYKPAGYEKVENGAYW